MPTGSPYEGWAAPAPYAIVRRMPAPIISIKDLTKSYKNGVQALKGVSAQQNEAARLQREVQLDNPTVSLEETMVAMQKAQIGFQATLQVRNRLVSAYSEIMNMQI